MPEQYAARLGDDIIHASVFADIATVVFEGLAIAAAGVIVAGVAVAAAPFVAAGGVAAATLTAAPGCLGSGLIAGFILGATGMMDELVLECEGIASAIFPPSPQGKIATGSFNVLTNDLPAARAAGRLLAKTVGGDAESEAEGERDYVAMLLNTGEAFAKSLINPTVAFPPGEVAPANQDTVLCEKHPPMPVQFLAEGSSSVSVNDLPAVRSDDRTTCGATVSTMVSPNVIIGGAPVVIRPIHSGKIPGLDLILATASLLLTRNFGKMFKNLPCMLMTMGAGMIAGFGGNAVNAAHAAPTPVNAATGAKVLADKDDVDFVLPARFPLNWQRIYNSRNTAAGLFGRGWRTPFETWVAHEEELSCFYDEGGRELRFTLPEAGARTEYPDTGLLLAAGEHGQLLIADLDGSVWRLYLPDPVNTRRLRLTSLCDEYGNGLLLHYDALGRLSELKDTENSLTVALHYHHAAHPQRVSDIVDISGGNAFPLVHYDYSLQGQLASVTDASSVVLREFEYTPAGLMASHRMPSGLRCDYGWQQFEDDWRVVSYATSAGRRSRIHYDPGQGLTRVEESDGTCREHWWNADYLVERYVDEASGVWCFTWDENQQLTGCIAPDGAKQQFVYDTYGNLVEEHSAEGHVTRTHWLIHRALPREFTDAQNHGYQLEYDACHGVIAQKDALGQVSRFERDELGQVTAYINPQGGISRFTYNARGQVLTAQDCSGQLTRYSYDGQYRLSGITDAIGETSEYTYDAAGRLTAVRSAEGRQETLRRDSQGRLSEIVAADGTVHEYGYDEATGQLRFSRDARGGVVTRVYDPRGRLNQLTNQNNETYHFVWGENDRLQEEHGLDGVVTRYEYDACDRIIARIFAAGTDSALVHRFIRDADGKVTHRQTPDGVTEYRYDSVGQLTEARFTPEGGGARVLTLEYDPVGQLTSEHGVNGRVGYQYDGLGNRTAVILPDGRSLKTLYYGNGHALQVMLDTQLITEFSRDALHRETGRTQGALNSGWRYDRQGRICERWTGRTPQTALALRREQWRYDLRDNLTQVQQSVEPFRERQYSYDGADRIIRREEIPGATVRYRYDGASNPLNEEVTVPHWAHNRVLQHRGTSYRYDIYGRTTEKRKAGERWLYRYDSEHRLIQVLHQPVSETRPECVVDFDYDVLGRRMSKRVHYRRMEDTAGGPQYRARETRFLWEGPRLLAEYNRDNKGDNVQVYVYSDQHSFAPLARIDGGGEVYYFHCQVNGQPEAMTSSGGVEVWRCEPDIRGKMTSENSGLELAGRGAQNLMMQGQYLDRETGLHYNLHRYYDPDSGRFTQQDPIGLAGGLNLYQYAPNPLGWIDPLGLAKIVRGMTDDNGSPKVGPSARELGARPGTDIKVDSNGNVHPNSGGVSVSPDTDALPGHRKSPKFGGTGKDPVWELDTSELGNDLKHVPDSPTHGTIQPSRTMSLGEYQKALASTKGKWKLCH